MYFYVFPIKVKYKKTFLLRKCPSQGVIILLKGFYIQSKKKSKTKHKKNPTKLKQTKPTSQPNAQLLPFEEPVHGTVGFLWLLLMKGIAEMHISTARPLHSQILMQGAMDNVTAPRCGTDLELVNTTLSSAQLQSPPLPTSMFCICEKPMLKVQDK